MTLGTVVKDTQSVWSLGVRLLHWTLALSMIGSFATHESGGAWHENLGYVALAAAILRVVLGFWASGYWRFSQFVKGFQATWLYATDVINQRELRYLGHNPLGAWMVVALLTDAILTTDRFWGVHWLEELHGVLGKALLPLLFLHIFGVIFTSYRHKENLLASMLHGRKPRAGLDDVS
jgi:cytochrome b